MLAIEQFEGLLGESGPPRCAPQDARAGGGGGVTSRSKETQNNKINLYLSQTITKKSHFDWQMFDDLIDALVNSSMNSH